MQSKQELELLLCKKYLLLVNLFHVGIMPKPYRAGFLYEVDVTIAVSFLRGCFNISAKAGTKPLTQ